MKLKAWDEPLAYPKFSAVIRRLDPSFSDSQIRTLFNKLKSPTGLVDIPTMIANLTGTECDTVDFKNQFFKDLYTAVYSGNKSDQLILKLEQHDDNNDGKINADSLIKVLASVSKLSEEKCRKFVRQLDKDINYKVSYVKLTDKICSLGNKDHNPLR
jgi:Ca2+-binding EF-hand superfamily protein